MFLAFASDSYARHLLRHGLLHPPALIHNGFPVSHGELLSKVQHVIHGQVDVSDESAPGILRDLGNALGSLATASRLESYVSGGLG